MINFLSAQAGGISFIVIFTVLTVVVFAAAIWLLCIGIRGDEVKLKLKPRHIFYIVLSVGIVIRAVAAFSMRGAVGTTAAESSYKTGYVGMVNMVNALVTNGFSGFFETYKSIMYYPLTMLILTFFGSIASLFAPLGISSTLTLIFIKLPFIISDALLALVIYKISAKFVNELSALAVGGLAALCPVFMLGAIWPTVYSFFALALVIMLYFMLERKYIKLTIAYFASLMICFEAIYLLPIVATFVIYGYVKKVSSYKADKPSGSIWNSEYGLIIKLPVVVVVCLIASYLITLPFTLSAVGANPFIMLYEYYIKPFNELPYFTFNGLSLYTLFNKNGSMLNLSFPVFVFSLIFAASITAVTLIVYLSKKNRANLVMFTAYLLLTMNVYFVNSSELTLLPCLAALLIAFVILKDRRLLQITGILSLFVFLNATGMLLQCNYFQINATFSAETMTGGWMVMTIICSVATVLAHIYFTIVLLDIVMNGKLKKLYSIDNRFGSAMKGFIRIKEIDR